MSKTQHSTQQQSPAVDAWRDVWSDDREATRVMARMAEQQAAMSDAATIDDRYSDADYRSALARAMSATS